MRVTAARLTEHGQPLQVEEVDLAEPGPPEVIMDVAFSGVNPVDLYAAQGRVAPDAPLPRTLGTAVAAGQMSVPVDQTVPLAQVNEAFGRITGRQSRGKIVLDTTG
ncbi:MAG TPA: zinc-binding dehydrogenase [Streptosporangiaceae bacterium]|nr:zinc-binding dehydrogenase [Streptosporangiaceae bacterium]